MRGHKWDFAPANEEVASHSVFLQFPLVTAFTSYIHGESPICKTKTDLPVMTNILGCRRTSQVRTAKKDDRLNVLEDLLHRHGIPLPSTPGETLRARFSPMRAGSFTGLSNDPIISHTAPPPSLYNPSASVQAGSQERHNSWARPSTERRVPGIVSTPSPSQWPSNSATWSHWTNPPKQREEPPSELAGPGNNPIRLIHIATLVLQTPQTDRHKSKASVRLSSVILVDRNTSVRRQLANG